MLDGRAASGRRSISKLSGRVLAIRGRSSGTVIAIRPWTGGRPPWPASAPRTPAPAPSHTSSPHLKGFVHTRREGRRSGSQKFNDEILHFDMRAGWIRSHLLLVSARDLCTNYIARKQSIVRRHPLISTQYDSIATKHGRPFFLYTDIYHSCQSGMGSHRLVNAIW